jgi:hypothetical protein
MQITMKTCAIAVLLALGQAPNSVLAGNEAIGGFVGGLIGSMAGQAISQQRQQPQVQPQPVQQYQAPEPQVQRRAVAPAVVRSSPLQVAYESESAPNRLQIQKYLRDKGFYASTLDGKWGPKVGSALSAYAASERQPELAESSSGSLRLMAMILDAHQGGDQTPSRYASRHNLGRHRRSPSPQPQSRGLPITTTCSGSMRRWNGRHFCFGRYLKSRRIAKKVKAART